MVSDPFLVGVFFGFVPSMGFLYILLNRFEGLFNDKRAFFAYLLGLGGGLIATILQLFLGPAGTESTALAVTETILFGVVHALIFAMVLNSKRFRRKRDTPFYGVGFGLGFGALNVLFLVGNAVQELAKTPGTDLVEILAFSYIGLYFMGSILVHAAMGAWIGQGTAQGTLLVKTIQSAILEAAYLLGFYVLFIQPISAFMPLLGLVVGIVLAHRLIKYQLEPIIPPEIRREMELHQRRVARQTMRDVTPTSGTDPDAAQTPAAKPEDAPGRDPRSP